MEPINVIGLDPWKEPAHFPASMDPLFENAFKCTVPLKLYAACFFEKACWPARMDDRQLGAS